MVFAKNKSSDSGASKTFLWWAILGTTLCVIASTAETFNLKVLRDIHSDSDSFVSTTISNKTYSAIQRSLHLAYPGIPDFNGKSRLHSSCDYVLYSVLFRPIQKHTVGTQHSKDLILPLNFKDIYDEALQRHNFTELDVENLICSSEGFEVGFQTPLQCSNLTKQCECLIINDLHTVQPLGVAGCLADVGSYCALGAIECAFGYDCIEGLCSGVSATIKFLPSTKIVVVIIIIKNVVRYL